MRAPILLMLLTLTACSRGAEQQAGNGMTANGFQPPATVTPTPLPGQEHAVPLDAFVGKYPTDIVAGVTFYDRTEVATGMDRAVGDAKVRQAIVERTSVSAPIFRDGAGRIAAWGCEQHNCGDHNWTIFIAAKPGDSLACYHDASSMGDASRWYAGSAPTSRPGGCPSDDSNETKG